MSGLRAQIAKLIATLKKQSGPTEEDVDPPNAPEEPVAMDTAEEEPEQAQPQAPKPTQETRVPSFAEAVRKNLRVSQLEPLAQEKFAQLRSIASSYTAIHVLPDFPKPLSLRCTSVHDLDRSDNCTEHSVSISPDLH